MTGIPDSHVMLHDGENDSVVTDNTCKIEPTWNASVCKGDIGRLNLSDSRENFRARSISNRGPPGSLCCRRSVVGTRHKFPSFRPNVPLCFLVVLRRRPSRLFATARNSRSPAIRAP